MNKNPKQITIHNYNPAWPKMFYREAGLIGKVLGAEIVAVHHIGSTSVPGLKAKEDLDILCIVDQLASSLNLQDIGYVLKGELNIPLRYFFSKNDGTSKVNLHVTEKDHGFIKLNLCFCDYLRTHPAALEEYAKLKDSLLKDPKSFEKISNKFSGYNLGKDRFIKNSLDQAGFNDVTINFCAHYREWEEYHRIAREQIFEPMNILYDPNHPSLDDTNHYHFVLYQGTKIVSIAHVEFPNEDEAALRKLATDTPYKNQKFCIKMMEILEKWCKLHKKNTIKLHSRLNAVEFYRKLGYADINFDDPCMLENYISLGKSL